VTPLAGTRRNAPGSTVEPFDYLDYRAYLRALYAERRALDRSFSHRAFCKRAGLRSTNYLSLVMKGERNLTPAMALRFAKACGLKAGAGDYFCALVAFNQAKEVEVRDRCYARLGKFRRFRQVHQIDAAQAAYHASWYVPAIRELCTRPDFREDPAWIARTLLPQITRAQARAALDTLQQLGFLRRDAGGRLQQVDALVTTGKTPDRAQVVRYHRGMLERASAALDLVPREEREMSSLTLCVSEATMQRLMARINELRRELLQVAEVDGPADRVVQINFQLFPLSRSRGDTDDS